MPSNDSAQQIYLAMDSGGEAIVGWNGGADPNHAGDYDTPYAAIRSAGTNSSFEAPVALATPTGLNQFGVAINEIVMDAAGDALAGINGEQPYTGTGGTAGDQVIDAEVVRRPAGGVFDTAHPQVLTDGTHNGYPRALAMSPNGKAVLVIDTRVDNESAPLAPESNSVQVTTSPSPGAAFNGTLGPVETVTNPLSGYPSVDTGSIRQPDAAIDDAGDYAFTYVRHDSISTGLAKASINGVAGATLNPAGVTDAADGPVVIDSTGRAVALLDDINGTEYESVRPAGGAFGTSVSPGGSVPAPSTFVNAANEEGANGQILYAFDGVGTNSSDVAASIGSASGSFPAAATLASNDDNFAFGTGGAIDKAGDAAVVWLGGTNGDAVRVAVEPPAAPPPATHKLSVTRSGSGSGSVTSSPAGINCGSSCSKAFSNGAQVTLTAKAASGSKFSGWSGACSGAASCKVTLSADKSVTATFHKSTSKPNTRITSHKVNKGKRQATFKFTAIGKATGFQCALVKLPKKQSQKAPKPKFSRCGSPKSYKHVKSGSYKFEVRAVNAAVADPTPATASFKI